MFKLDLQEASDVIEEIERPRYNYGSKARISDYALLTGIDIPFSYTINWDQQLLNGRYWTKTSDLDRDTLVIDEYGKISWDFITNRKVGLRLKMAYSEVKDYLDHEVKIGDNISEVTLGNLPRRCLSQEEARELERLYRSSTLQTNGNYYTVNGLPIKEKGFMEVRQLVYTFFGKNYVRVKANTINDMFLLPNGETLENNKFYWVEVEPVTWIVDKKNDLMITKEIVLAGIPFDLDYSFIKDFSETFIAQFMNNVLVNEMFYGVKRKEQSKVYMKR